MPVQASTNYWRVFTRDMVGTLLIGSENKPINHNLSLVRDVDKTKSSGS